MYGIRVYTSGRYFLSEFKVDVIGYEIHHPDSIDKVWLQPKEDTYFNAETMEDFNNISISELKEVGIDRNQGIVELLKVLNNGEECVCWYSTFIKSTLSDLLAERKQSNSIELNPIDLWELATISFPNRPSYALVDFMQEFKVDNLVSLYKAFMLSDEFKGVNRL